MENVKILIAEDELITAEAIKKTLKRLWYAIALIVSSGKEAIREIFDD